MSEIKAGYGYRLVKVGEVFIEGDQQKVDDVTWIDRTSTLGQVFDGSQCITRRRIDPGEGYEIVPEGENEIFGMQYTRDGITWMDNAGSVPLLSAVGDYIDILAFRRRKQAAPTDGWIKLTPKSLPEAKKPIWVAAIESQYRRVDCRPCGVPCPEDLIPNGWTHWRPSEGNYQIPATPEPEKSEAEKAFDEWKSEYFSGLTDPAFDLKLAYEAARSSMKGASK